MRCSKCDTDNRNTAKFCDKCGAPLLSKCGFCEAENRPDARFCYSCGAALGAAEAAASKKSVGPQIRIADTPVSEIINGERKTVTALFADIKGSTELEQDLDPEQARAIVDPALKRMIDAVDRYDGYVVQSTGDGIFALFGAPVAHEDHPQRALYAALRMQEELRRYSTKLVADGGNPLQCRVGINTGEVVVRSIATGKGHAEYTPIGHTTNLASRMQAVAPVGSIAVAESTRKLCEGYFVLKSLGPTRVRGVAEPVNVYEVTGLGPLRTRLQRAVGRGLTKFVGRQHEMDVLKHALEQARAGRGQVVAAMAEPGVGKSRLFFEFKAVSQSGCMVLETFSVSHGKASAYLPVIELLHGYFAIEAADDGRKRREKVTGRVVALDRALEETLPYLFALLGLVEGEDPLAQMDGQIKKRRTLEAIERILLRESLNQPLMVIFEDLHWIDDQTQEFLNLLADSIGTAKILLLVNYRPEYSHQWNSKTYYTQLRLDRLGKESANEMLLALLGNAKDLEPLKGVIIGKTEGNPFFMEETVQMLLDEGALARDGPTVTLTRPVSELKIPPTVQGILAARIDRLAPDTKELLQTLSVIGREFPMSLIRAVVPKSDDELNRMLGALQLGEFIYEQPAVGDTEYIFKHALTQEVSHNSVLLERRRQLHERIGAALELTHAESLDEHVAELARHYARSGNPSKGVEFCLRALQQCADRGSFAEATAQFETGLELLQKLPDDDRRAELELDLRNAGGFALMTTKGWGSPEFEQSSARAIVLCQRPGINWEKTWSALYIDFVFRIFRTDMRKACEIAAEMIARAEEHRSAEHIAAAADALAMARMDSGDFELAAQGFDRAWALWESIAKPATGLTQQRAGLMPQAERIQLVRRLARQANNRIQTAWNLWFLGYPDRALERINIATAIAGDLKNALEIVHHIAAQVYELRRELEHMRERAEAMLLLSTESGNVSDRNRSEMYLGWAQAMAGDLEGGVARMRHHHSELRASGYELLIEYTLALIATALSRMGRFDEGLCTINESFPIIERTGARWYEAEVHRLKGELLLAQGASNAEQAEQSFRTAIEISRKQRAKSWELRAATSLARLLRDNNRRDEAREMLSDIYNWFTEGFDTADLKDAKALLDELGA